MPEHKKRPHNRIAFATLWGTRILLAVTLLITGYMALIRHPRLGWMVLLSLFSILLTLASSLNMRRKYRTIKGVAHRIKRVD